MLHKIKNNLDDFFEFDISTKKKKRDCVDARRIYSKICKDKFKDKFSLEEIGSQINRSHCSIIHFIKSHDNLYDTDEAYRNLYNNASNYITKCDPSLDIIIRLKEERAFHIKRARDLTRKLQNIT